MSIRRVYVRTAIGTCGYPWVRVSGGTNFSGGGYIDYKNWLFGAVLGAYAGCGFWNWGRVKAAEGGWHIGGVIFDVQDAPQILSPPGRGGSEMWPGRGLSRARTRPGPLAGWGVHPKIHSPKPILVRGWHLEESENWNIRYLFRPKRRTKARQHPGRVLGRRGAPWWASGDVLWRSWGVWGASWGGPKGVRGCSGGGWGVLGWGIMGVLGGSKGGLGDPGAGETGLGRAGQGPPPEPHDNGGWKMADGG